ncbi:prepilin peptidase, partial [Azospirillum sp. A39]
MSLPDMTSSDMVTLAQPLFALLASPFVGSFVGLVADRLPRGEPVAWGRSRCRACGRTLGPAELVPVLSWLWQRGRCAGCGAAIPPALAVVELAAAALALWALAVVPGWLLWPTLGLGWTLLALAAVDAWTEWLPDRLTVPLGIGGLAVNGWLAGGVPGEALLGALLGWGAFAVVILAYRRLRGRDGLGWGDAALLGAGGAWVGWPG